MNWRYLLHLFYGSSSSFPRHYRPLPIVQILNDGSSFSFGQSDNILAQYEDLRLYINYFGLLYTIFVDLKPVKNSHALAALVAYRLYLRHKTGFKTQFLIR